MPFFAHGIHQDYGTTPENYEKLLNTFYPPSATAWRNDWETEICKG